jgi:hypothetical protein
LRGSRSNKNHEDTDHQILEERQKAAALKHKLNTWIQARMVYIPMAQLLDDSEKAKSSLDSLSQPWDTKLWLPSSIPENIRHTGCFQGLPDIEKAARITMCLSDLAQLRTGLRMRHHALQSMRIHAFGSGEKTMTRARARITGIQTRLDRTRDHYRTCFTALLSLDWTQGGFELLRELRDADISGPSREADEVDLERRGALKEGLASIGTYQQSWIWTTF